MDNIIKGSLVILKDGDDVLLIEKAYDPMKGLVSLPGGKKLEHETYRETAKREVQEETAVGVSNLKEVGDLITRKNFQDGDLYVRCMVYMTNDWRGVHHTGKWPGFFIPSDECGAFWCHKDSIPYDRMFPDFKYWLPDLISGQCESVKVHSYYNDLKLQSITIDTKLPKVCEITTINTPVTME